MVKKRPSQDGTLELQLDPLVKGEPSEGVNMPNLGYSQLMAEMIARARPQQAPGQTRPGFVGGGGGMGIVGRQAQTQVDIDLEPWMRLFGWKSPKEKQEIWNRFLNTRQQYADKPEEWEKLRSSLNSQKLMEAMDKAGGYPVVVDAQGRYDIPLPSAETMGVFRHGPITKEKAMTGVYGEEP